MGVDTGPGTVAEGGAGSTAMVSIARRPRAIDTDPKMMKQPSTAIKARLIGRRPCSIRKPIAAVAIVAIATAGVPSSRPRTQLAA